MATLEVHDAHGRVRFIDVDLDHPILFGTSPTCDVELEGEGVLPVHGRIRWGGKRLKVDASPDAEFLVVNGRRIVTSGLRQGDELVIGSCRIFVLRIGEDEAIPPRARSKHKRRPDDEATVVLQGAPGRSSATGRSPVAPPSPAFEDDDLFKALEIETPDRDEPEGEPIESGRSQRKKPKREPGEGWLGRRLKRWRKELQAEAAPGREVVATSPVVLGLVVLLALLVGMGFWLHSIIKKTVASTTYNRAVSLMEDGDYATAIRDFDAFLTANPADARANKARVLRALSNVRQYITLSGATWSRALETAREMADTVGDLPEFRDEKTELAELVIRIGEGLADRAKRNVDPKSLAEAESAIPLHARIAGEPAPAFLTRSRLPDLLSEARAAVQKSKVRAETLAAMDAAIAQADASRVYKSRDSLIQRYADLRTDAEILKRMIQANDLMRKAARVDLEKRPAETTERPESLGPITSFVLRSTAEPPSASPSADAIGFALADGIAYAIDGGSGAPIWQAAVGLSSPFTPRAVPGDLSVLMVDAHHNDLVRRDARSGKLIWRLDLGEPVDAPPMVLGDRVVQTLPSGKVVFVSLETGELQATVDLGFPVTQTPVGDESGRFVYVLGNRDCLFVLTRDPIGCEAVEYLGHGEGSILCPPVRMGRFLIVAENNRPRDGRWRVLVLDDDGAKPRAVQELPVAGWTWDSPPTSGSIVWAIGDRGGIEAFAAGDYASASPLRSLAKLNPDVEASGPAFAIAPTEREVWIAAGRAGRFDLDAERGEIKGRSTLGRLGVAAAPIQTSSNRVILSFLDDETGGVSLRGIDPSGGPILWETVLGAAWPTLPAAVNDGEALAVIDTTGRRLRASRTELGEGGFITSRLPGPGEPRIPEGRLLTVERDGSPTALIAPPPGSDAIWVEDPKAEGHWRRVGLPSPLAATPLPWASGLFTPGEDGRAYLIDPASGTSLAEPLVPEFDREHHGRWLAPCLISDGSTFLVDDAGKVRRIGLTEAPARRLTIEAETALDQPIIADPAATESALILTTADGRVRSLSARDLAPIGAWDLDAPIVGSPRAVEGRVVVLDASGGATLLDRDGRRAWTAKLDAKTIGDPLIVGETLWFLDQNGQARGLSVDHGKEIASINLGAFPAGGLIAAGPDIYAPTGRGAVQRLSLDAANQEGGSHVGF